ncbi:4Fe-4S binding protein [Brevibacillus ginsengisoli]|uniref:4Fe-4S binding protein n=1 Tax=Brevibacillus ginsengisoli TaxID=363854 RepID=UPI003CF6EB17
MMGIFSRWIESLDYEVTISKACTRKKSPHSRCDQCLSACSKQALLLHEGQVAIDRNLCNDCGECLVSCPVQAIKGIYPKRNRIGEHLVYSDEYVPTEKELLVHYKKGIKAITTAGKQLNEKWKDVLSKTNESLEKLGETPFRVVEKQLTQEEVTYTRRELFFFWKEESQSLLKEIMPAQFRFNQEDLNLLHHYPDFQFASIEVNQETCSICGACTFLCPTHCIKIEDGKMLLQPSQCTKCNLCAEICPEKAISVTLGILPKKDTILLTAKKVCEQCGSTFESLSQDGMTCVSCTKRGRFGSVHERTGV